MDGTKVLLEIKTFLEKIYTRAGSGEAATIADGADVTQGLKADSAATDSTSSWSVIALLKGLYARLASTIQVVGDITSIRIAAATVAIGSTAYESGDLMGTKLTLTNAMRISGGSGYLMSIILEDYSEQNGAIDIIIFDSDPSGTTFTDAAVLDIAEADLAKVLGHVSIASSDYASFSDNSIATKVLINLPVVASGSANLYACLVSRDTKTYTANEIAIRAIFDRN